MIEIHKLTKYFDDITAVDHVDVARKIRKIGGEKRG